MKLLINNKYLLTSLRERLRGIFVCTFLLFALSTSMSAQYTLNDWKIKDMDSVTNGLHLNLKEYKLDFNHPLPYTDMQKCWNVKAELKCGTLGTEQVFVCKEGKGDHLIGKKSLYGDISIGYDPMLGQFFAEVIDRNEEPHRIGAGLQVVTGEWYSVEASAQYDVLTDSTTLTLTVVSSHSTPNSAAQKTPRSAANEISAYSKMLSIPTTNRTTYPGKALRHNASLWVIGRGYPNGATNALQVRDGYIRNLSISGEALDRVDGQNPIFTDAFTADPAFTVMGNTVYAYVGEDKAGPGGWFNMPHWLCYTSTDMKHWTAHGPVLKAADFPYASPWGAWAGQVVEHEGKYYYYVTLDRRQGGAHTIDVAVSDSPLGPFRPARKDGTPLITDDMTPDSHRPNADIDPTVLIDDDGTPWMAWGNGDCYMVRLKRNMIELDGEIRKVPMRYYSEGPWLFKRGNLYYNVYAADAPGVQPEQMCYSTAESMEGPWTFRGYLTTSANHGFTIHPSVIQFKGQWYFIYHDGSYSRNGEPGGDCRRSVCVEYLYFNADGTIRPIPLTQEGLSSHLTTETDIWNLAPLTLEQGPFVCDWDELSRKYNVPAWWRDAKLGAWSHWDPQSAAEDGDWYSRSIYMEGHPQARYHREHYGHPSEYGYKDLCRDWDTDLWNPDDLMQLYRQMGARYFLAMGNHHDNFDCWNSAYQPWNSVNVGPHQDIVGIWKQTADKYGMPFGIGFHNTPARTWGQFMAVRYTSDRKGEYAGKPYDALLTKTDGKGKWWEGLDPKDLYGPEHHDGRYSLDSPFANQFMYRVDDAIRKYQPDMIYFDDHAGDSQVDLGINMGLGKLTPQIITNFYNIASKRTSGNREVVATFKGVGGRYNSFQNSPELLPLVDRSLVKSTEFYTEDDIMAYPFQTELSLQEWHYQQGGHYRSAAEVITRLMQNVSRNGCLLLNVTQRGRGNIDDEARQICTDIGKWIDINSEAIYGSRPFDVCGEGDDIIYTRHGGYLYVTLINVNSPKLTLRAIVPGKSSIRKVKSIRMIEGNQAVDFRQTDEGLEVTIPTTSPAHGINDQQLASGFKVLKVEYADSWFNDDDPGVVTYGWDRQVGAGKGHYNNDLSFSTFKGGTWSTEFDGRQVNIVAPMGDAEGTMQVSIDGNIVGEVHFMKRETMTPHQIVFKSGKLKQGKHNITLTTIAGIVSVDALIIK